MEIILYIALVIAAVVMAVIMWYLLLSAAEDAEEKISRSLSEKHDGTERPGAEDMEP